MTVTTRRRKTHGHSSSATGQPSPTYKSWQQMKSRCHSPTHHAYVRYGGRGIVVCERWRQSFEHFLADMGERHPATSLDRIDPDGNYEPGNCRWATPKQQVHNRGRGTKPLRFMELNGERKTLREWAQYAGMSESGLSQRLDRGLSLEQALTEPSVRVKTHCKHGHEFTPENTKIVGGSIRDCRECRRRSWRESNWRRRQAVQP